MNFESILLEKKNSIAYVTVNRPEGAQCAQHGHDGRIAGCLYRHQGRSRNPGAILTGSGEKIVHRRCDIGELAKHDVVNAKEYTHRGQSVLDLIENLGKPVIACIHGFALGGGCEIAMACTCGWPARMRSWDNRRCSWHPSRLRRDATVAAAGRQRDRDATGAHGRDDLGRGGAPHRAGERSHRARRPDSRAEAIARRSSPMRPWPFSMRWRR